MYHLCVIKGLLATLGGIKTTRLAPFPTAPTATYCYPMGAYNILAMCALRVWGSRGGSFLRKKVFQKRLHLERASSKLSPFQDGFAYFPVPRVWPWAERLLAFQAVAARCFHSLQNLNKTVRSRVLVGRVFCEHSAVSFSSLYYLCSENIT